jgi:hypothetical protein
MQVIYIGDQNMVNKLRNHQRWHDHIKDQALLGQSVFDGSNEKPLPTIDFDGTAETQQPGGSAHGPPSIVVTTLTVAGATAEGAR